MRMPFLVASFTLALAVGRSAMLAAPAPEQTQRPGEMTQARVWIENRGRGEAVPISLQEAALDTPLRVRVMNGQIATGADEPVNVRVVRQPRIWQYQSVTVKPDQSIAAALSTQGATGWETTGIVSTSAEGTTLLLKRLR